MKTGTARHSWENDRCIHCNLNRTRNMKQLHLGMFAASMEYHFDGKPTLKRLPDCSKTKVASNQFPVPVALLGRRV